MPDQLDCHPFSEFAVGPGGQVDRSHAAAADLPDQFVSTDPQTYGRRRFQVVQRSEGLDVARQVLEEPARILVRVQKRVHFATQFGVAGAALVQEGPTLRWSYIQGSLEYRFDVFPAFGGHGGISGPSQEPPSSDVELRLFSLSAA